MPPTVRLGELVSSKAGRDKAEFYLIIGIINDSFVYVADGDLRRVEAPKRKNLKHLNLYGEVAERIAAKLRAGVKISNPEVSAALHALTRADGQDPSTIRGGL